MRSLLQDTKEGRTIMEILGKVLSEKTEAIYKDITGGLIYPIKIVKLDPRMRKTAAVRLQWIPERKNLL